MATLKASLSLIKRQKDFNWKVVSELGAGAYGSVYKVIQVKMDGTPYSPMKEYAMKTESKSAGRASSRLKIEKHVMTLYSTLQKSDREHFPELIDIGQTSSIKYIVMTLVGPSLEALKRDGFSTSTALQVSLQTLKSIRDIHEIGFLHRDLKPANFCIGIDAKMNTVYMLDFGLARTFKKNGIIRSPRPRTKMVGTPRYCARASHQMQELARKDDYESWFFMLLDFMDIQNGISWKGKSREEAFLLKQKVFEESTWFPSFTSTIPSAFFNMALYLNELDYQADVEWGVFRETITDYARQMKLTLRERLDWIAADGKQKLIVAAPKVPRNADNGSMTTEEDDNDSVYEKSKLGTGKKSSSMSNIKKGDNRPKTKNEVN